MKNKEEFLDSVYEKYEAKKEQEQKNEYKTVKTRKRLYKQFGVVAACIVLCVGMISVTGAGGLLRGAGSAMDMAYEEEATNSFAVSGSDAGYAKNSAYMDSDSAVAVTEDIYELDGGSDVADDGVFEPYEGEITEGSSAIETPVSNSKQELKLVYRASMTVQTTDFDKTVNDVKAYVEEIGGYLETQETYNGGYFEDAAYKSAFFTVRVPQEKYKEFLEQVGEGYHVSYLSESVEDIGKQYYETSSRIETLKIKEERLQKLLKQATEMSDIIELESALSENEYQLEMYQSTLADYDSLVNYSTISLNIEKVSQYSDGVTHELNFFERLWKSFKNGAINFGERIGDFFVWLGYNIFGIILLVAIVFVLIRFDIFGKIARFVKKIFRKGRKE